MTSAQPPRSAYGLPAPAKLNLFLHVVGRRSDGKHLLQSVFTLVDLSDTIDIAARSDDRIIRSGDVLCEPDKDLCVRAAEALKQAAQTAGKAAVGSFGADITVKKRIPAGAGMGGGSSDAATTLIALNRLWGLNFPRKELAAIGERVGADVPFFICGRTGFVEGIGERFTPFEVPTADYEILWPGVAVSTAKIFAAPSLTRNHQTDTITIFSDRFRSCWPALPGCNDLEPVARRIEPAVGAALELLSSAGFTPRMTGSGSAVFAVRPIGRPPLNEKLLPTGWRHFSVRSLAEHPLAAWI